MKMMEVIFLPLIKDLTITTVILGSVDTIVYVVPGQGWPIPDVALFVAARCKKQELS